MLEASAALTFRPNRSPAKVSVGVRTEALFGVHDQSTIVTPNNSANRYFISPFIRLTSPLGANPEPGATTNAYAAGDVSETSFGGVFEAGGWGGYL